MNSQKPRQPTQDLHRVKPGRISALLNEVNTKTQLLPRGYLQLKPHQKGKMNFLQCVSLDISSTLQGTMLRGSRSR